MPDLYGPFDDAPWSMDQWYRFAHTWAPSGVLGVEADAATPATGALGLTVTGLDISMATGRAWVHGAGYERTDTPWTATVAANLTAQPRIDALVLRRDLTARTVTPTLLTGTPAATPAAPTRADDETGQWDLPLYTWRVDAGAAALTNLTDARVWVDTETGYGFTSGGSGGGSVHEGILATSVWTSRAMPAAYAWQEVCWSEERELFVAVNSGFGAVAISPDGITWTLRTAANASSGVAWSAELGLFVAVGGSAASTTAAMTSPDGITWTQRTTTTGNWQSVCWSPELGLFVAVANTATTTQRVMTSPNGITWTARTITGTVANWQSVCWSAELGLFVAVASDTANGNLTVATSSDGITWAQRNANNALGWQSVCWSPELGLFVAVGNSGACMTSPQGFTWTVRTMPEAIAYNSVAWSPEFGLFAAVGSPSATGHGVAVSTDGITWTRRPNSNVGAGLAWTSVCWSPHLRMFTAVTPTTTGIPQAMTSVPAA